MVTLFCHLTQQKSCVRNTEQVIGQNNTVIEMTAEIEATVFITLSVLRGDSQPG